MPTIVGIIPARYASTRFPGKALAHINGKTMIQRVCEQAKKARSLQRVLVATDHAGIADHVRSFGGEVVMTRPDHPSGTDRCYEALQKSGLTADFVINIQGDEPFLHPQQINQLAAILGPTIELATLARPLTDAERLFSPHTPKVIFDRHGDALYFSRHPLPYVRGTAPGDWLSQHKFYQHIGIYAYRTDVLAAVTRLPPSPLEKAESLEQLRWLEHGYRIRVALTDYDTFGIDTPEDLIRAQKMFDAV